MAKRAHVVLLAMLAFGFLMWLTACGGPHPRAVVYVGAPPPALIAEAPGPAPGPGLVWIAGYHSWNGSAYVWVPGRWEHPPAGRHAWVRGQWIHGGRGWYWREGRWR
jgi:WXXGXW repeat (2 copies)